VVAAAEVVVLVAVGLPVPLAAHFGQPAASQVALEPEPAWVLPSAQEQEMEQGLELELEAVVAWQAPECVAARW
jgi:hypothetical protein